jgi:hypothetical protein
MFYLGMRSSRGYLDALARIRHGTTPSDIVTVAGGLAFLHAISPATQSLTIVDCDPDTLAHWSLIRALIAESTSLADFLTLLAGHAPAGPGSREVLGSRVDVRPRLTPVLSAADLATYDRTYGALDVDASRGVGRLETSIVGFTGTNLRRQHFNWQFGEGNLESDTAFAMLRRQLATMPVRVEHARFETLDFDRVFPAPAPGRQRIFLASNCESPLFTSGDAIFLRVLRTATRPVHYVSWNRDAFVSNDDVTPIASDVPPTDGHRATLLVTSRFAFARLRRGAQWSRIVSSLNDLQATPSYGFRLLVVAGQTEKEIAACLAAVAPAYRNVVWVPRSGGREAAHPIASPSYDRPEPIAFAGKPAWWFPLRGRCVSAPARQPA